jgi:hypothetical protein
MKKNVDLRICQFAVLQTVSHIIKYNKKDNYTFFTKNKRGMSEVQNIGLTAEGTDCKSAPAGKQMETNNYLFRSQFNKGWIVIPIITILGIWLFHLTLNISLWKLILIGILFDYLFSTIFQKRYYFYNNQIVRIFIFRPFYRKKVFRYEDIKLRYIHGRHRAGEPQFVIFFYLYRTICLLKNIFNTFYFHKHSERVNIVYFLLSKNVPIELWTGFEEEDKEIIDMVKFHL